MQASQYAGQLYDAFYAYAVALNRTLPTNPSLKNGREIIGHISMNFSGEFTPGYCQTRPCSSFSIAGISGEVVIGSNGTRYPTLYFDALNESLEVETFGTVFVEKMVGVSESLREFELEEKTQTFTHRNLGRTP